MKAFAKVSVKMGKGIKIKINTDFSSAPGPRKRESGAFSGEEFRERVLIPKFNEALEAGEALIIDLDGTKGYGQSFLEEAFGGLVRDMSEIDVQEISKRLAFISQEEPYLEEDIREMMRQARKALVAA